MADVEVTAGIGATRALVTVAGQNVFDNDFLAFEANSIAVKFEPAGGGASIPLTLNVDYTVAGLNQENGGSITLIGDYAGISVIGDGVLMFRLTPIERLFDYQTAGDFRAETVNRELDTVFMIGQELRRDIDLASRVPIGSNPVTIFAGAADTLAMFDGNNNLVQGPTVASVAGLAAITAAVVAVDAIKVQVVAVSEIDVEIIGLYAVRTQIAQLGPIAGAIAVLAPLDDELIALAPVAADIAALAIAAPNIATVAAVAAEVNTVAGIAADVTAAAANMAAIIAAPAEAAAAAQSALDAEASAIAIAQAAVMVGSTMEWNGPVPAGWLRFREGGTFNRATFPDLATFWDANGSFWGMTAPEIAAGQFPDTRDYVSRHAGGALGPAVGAKQEDAAQVVTGSLLAQRQDKAFGGNGAFTDGGDGGDATGIGTTGASPIKRVNFSNANSAGSRTATETRVKSFGVRYIIKASSAATNQGLVDMLALATSVNNLENRAIRDDVDQGAQAKSSAFKVNILKNTLQAWEQIGPQIDVTVAVAAVEWTGLSAYRRLRLYGSIAPTAADDNPGIQCGIAGVFDTGGNYGYQEVRGVGASISGASSSAANRILLCTAGVGISISVRGITFNLMLDNFNIAQWATMVARTKHRTQAGSLNATGIGGDHQVATAQDSLRILFGGSNVGVGSHLTLEGQR